MLSTHPSASSEYTYLFRRMNTFYTHCHIITEISAKAGRAEWLISREREVPVQWRELTSGSSLVPAVSREWSQDGTKAGPDQLSVIAYQALSYNNAGCLMADTYVWFRQCLTERRVWLTVSAERQTPGMKIRSIVIVPK